MPDYDNTNRLALFKNDRMREGKQDAPYRGKGELTCAHCQRVTEFWADMWKNEIKSKPGEFVLSVKLKAKDDQPQGGGGPTEGGASDDSIPFISATDPVRRADL